MEGKYRRKKGRGDKLCGSMGEISAPERVQTVDKHRWVETANCTKTG